MKGSAHNILLAYGSIIVYIYANRRLQNNCDVVGAFLVGKPVSLRGIYSESMEKTVAI